MAVDDIGNHVVLIIRDSSKNTKGEPERWPTTSDRVVGDGIHRRVPDAHLVGRPRDRALRQKLHRGGVGEPQCEKGRAWRKALRRLPQREGRYLPRQEEDRRGAAVRWN